MDGLDIINMSELSMPNPIDELESHMVDLPAVECPLQHLFTKGLYCRVITMPKGSLITSKIHKTQHPYFILQGKVTVYTDGQDTVTLEAPYIGCTQPGTRRALYIHEDTIWATAHPTDLTDVDEIEAMIIEPHSNPLLENKEEVLSLGSL